MMTSSSKPYLFYFTILFLISTCVKAIKESFVIDIIHRDSPKSPLFDNTTTHFQRIHNALLRSDQRMNYLFPNKDNAINNYDPRPTLFGQPGAGEYVMQYALGHPMFRTYGIIDTGSDLTWLQCTPCTRCYSQGNLPFLDTNFNWGLHAVECLSFTCVHIVNPSVTQVFCDYGYCQCKYLIAYADRSSTIGDVFATLLRLQTRNGDYIGFPTFIFGCSTETTGSFSTGASGIVGLGRGPASLVSQIRDSIEGKFGYCLVPVGQDAYSQMRFGQSAVISGPDVVITPMIATTPINYYHISFEGITVEGVYIPYITGNLGNAIIDSGTIVTRLPARLYSFVESQVALHLDRLYTRVQRRFYSLCYSHNNIETMGGPKITIHLRGGNLVLSPENIYIQVDYGAVCFNFKSHPTDLVIGTNVQANFIVSFDLQRREIGFLKINCASLS
ncbi:aspartic proteinase CDR1-like [Prosopis cineraria]|uniref:aspartic proteinase CDR1-like n=1 Tax=Prosopis cineraria TaxID=364024 RepID=UPI002410787F|nr:aspartic proteinase CDR1-like [Prosopis cineraria]